VIKSNRKQRDKRIDAGGYEFPQNERGRQGLKAALKKLYECFWNWEPSFHQKIPPSLVRIDERCEARVKDFPDVVVRVDPLAARLSSVEGASGRERKVL
jgi:hypothetical protein